MAAVADIPDAEHRLVVREQRSGGMRVVLPGRSLGDDNLPLQILRKVDVLQGLALLHPKRLLLRRRGFPRAFHGFGLRLSKRGERGEQEYQESGTEGHQIILGFYL